VPVEKVEALWQFQTGLLDFARSHLAQSGWTPGVHAK